MPRRAPANTSPLIRSSAILRGFATAITLSSLGGMTAFAATHVQNAGAPLAPSAPTTTAATTVVATPAPTARATTSRQRATTLTSSVGTTTTAARTKTKQS